MPNNNGSENGKDIPLIYMKGITQRFGLIEALCNVDFAINRQEIVGLLGDNGAGKSTLIKVLTGIHRPSSGRIYFDGKPVIIESPKKARRLGIETVYQDLALVNLMSVARNFYLGREPLRYVGPVPLLDQETMNTQSVDALANIGIDIRRPEEEVLRLSGGERQSIAIGRAVHFGLKLLILDEPTSALSVGETQKVLHYTLEAKKAGLSVIFITHNITHVYQVADRFTILNHGEKVGDFYKDEVNEQEISSMIMGTPIPDRLSPVVQERAVEVRAIGDKLVESSAAQDAIVRKTEARNRNIVIGAVVGAIFLCLLMLVGSGAFNPPAPTPTPSPTPTVVAEVPEDVQERIDQLLNDPDVGRRAIAASWLGAERNQHPAALEPLIQALQDEAPEVRQNAARALGKIGDDRAIQPLQELLRDNQSPVRDAAAEALQNAFGLSCSASDGCK